MRNTKNSNKLLWLEVDKMSIAANGEGGFDKEYLEEGIARLQEEDQETPTPENEEAIEMAEKALEELEEQ